jgi:serpin B
MSVKHMRFFAVLIVFALVAAACGSDGETVTTTGPGQTTTTRPTPTTASPGTRTEAFTPGEVIRVDLPRMTPEITDADIAAVVVADAAFGLDLFEVVAGDENLMVSPYSIATALSMLYPGARGTTATEIADVLHLTVEDAALHAVRNFIDTALATPTPPMGDEDTREPFTIRPANSAWGQGGYPFLEEYLGVRLGPATLAARRASYALGSDHGHLGYGCSLWGFLGFVWGSWIRKQEVPQR